MDVAPGSSRDCFTGRPRYLARHTRDHGRCACWCGEASCRQACSCRSYARETNARRTATWRFPAAQFPGYRADQARQRHPGLFCATLGHSRRAGFGGLQCRVGSRSQGGAGSPVADDVAARRGHNDQKLNPDCRNAGAAGSHSVVGWQPRPKPGRPLRADRQPRAVARFAGGHRP